MDNQRLILIIALSFVLFLIWQAWVQEQMARNPPAAPPTAGTSQQAGQTDGAATEPVPAADVPVPLAAEGAAELPLTDAEPKAETSTAERIRVTTQRYIAEIDPVGGSVVRVGLREYPEALDKKDQPFILLDDNPANLFIAQSGLVASSGAAPDHYQSYSLQQREYAFADGAETLEVPLTWQHDSGVTVTKTLRFNRDSYVIDINHSVENAGAEAWQGRQYRQFQRTPPTESRSLLGGVYTYTGAVLSTPEDPYDKVDFDAIGERQQSESQLKAELAGLEGLPVGSRDEVRLGAVRSELAALEPQVPGGWVAMIQHYFLAAWVPAQEETNRFYTKKPQVAGNRHVVGMLGAAQTVAPGASASFDTKLYVGPKIQADLEALAPNLSRVVDYGWLWFISEPLFKVLKWIHGWIGNWGWAIILLTMMIKAVFYKLSETSYRSMANMRKLGPQMQKLKDRYGDDRQKMNQAMMEMYKKEKINPLGGCLPIVVQIPVFIALYWMLLESVELRQAPWMGWIDDLSTKDPFYILPLIMGASMFIQQRLNPAPPDPIQAKVMMALPIVFTFFFLWFPAGLVLYWVVNNVLSIIQQWIITKRVAAGSDKPVEKASGKT